MSEHFSFDRHVDSDPQFTRGRWELKAGVKIFWAMQNIKSVVHAKSIYSVFSSRNINHRGDTLNNPILTTNLSSPFDGVVKLETYHNKSTYKNSGEPRFEVAHDSPVAGALAESGSTLDGAGTTTESTSPQTNHCLRTGDMSANVDPNIFNISFSDNTKNLTQLGFKSVGTVEDSRFPKPHLTGHKYSDYFTCQFHLSVGERIYGLGERFGAFVKNGQSIEMWNEDGGTSSNVTYKNVPFYMSNRGYGVFVDSTTNVNFNIQHERTTRVNIVVPGQGVRIYVIHGPNPKTILHRYAQLTGFPALPPVWSFGLWLSTSFLTSYDYNTVSSFLQGMVDRHIPVSAFHFDCFWMKGFQWCDFKFDPQYFPDAKKMLSDLKSRFGVKICVWINSYIGQESELFDEADINGYLIKKTENGASYQCDLWQGGMGIVDFTNPKACEWYQQKLLYLMDMGVDSFKTDFGERIPLRDVTYYSGENPVGMHNYYAYLYNKCVFDAIELRTGPGNAAVFARSATAGGQKFPVHWGGDCESTFEAMSESLRGGLSLGLCGFGFWSHDIGGFEGSPHPAVYKRWCAFGLLSSHSRLHGSHSYRVPWNFDEESSFVLLKFTNLKLSLMPYIYRHAIEAVTTATPVMRPMILEYPDDVIAQTCDRQFMLGPSLLVAPVFNAEGDVSFYLPKGKWYGLLDGKTRIAGGKGEYFDEVHDFHSLPLLVRENSVFISNENHGETPDYEYEDGFTVNIYDVVERVTVEIPQAAKPGQLGVKVTVTPNGDGYDVTTDYKGKYSVKVLGRE